MRSTIRPVDAATPEPFIRRRPTPNPGWAVAGFRLAVFARPARATLIPVRATGLKPTGPSPGKGLMMSPCRLRSSALAAPALATAVLANGAAAADLTRSFAVGVNGCDDAFTSQLCTPVPTVALPTDGVLQVEFDASTSHCSDMVAHLLVDGVEQFASGALAPGQGTGVQDFGPVAAGVHQVGVQAEGVLGGCNPGSLAIWSGTLSVTISGVTEADAAVAAPGDSVSVSTVVGGAPAPAAVEASYTRPLDALGLATLSTVTFPTDPILPVDPILPIGSVAFVDLLLLGADAADELQAHFLPPDPILPPNPVLAPNPVLPPNPVRLAYYDGANWSAVLDSDGDPPAYVSATNSFSVAFTATSTPQVTALSGTVFAFVASYGLVGFAPPVVNDALNVAKAGRAIPLKWRLYDLGGNPVTDLAPTAVHVTSVSVACSDLTEGPDAVEEYATGASGLQNLGDGAYQLNWATSEAFAGTCRRLRLDLGEQNPDGTPFYRTADFSFVK